MKFEIKLESTSGLWCVELRGDIYLSDYKKTLVVAWNTPGYVEAACAIWDFSKAKSKFEYEHVEELVNWISEHKLGRGPTKVAVIAPEDLEFGMSRVFTAFEDEGGYTIQVYRTKEKAYQWLQKK